MPNVILRDFPSEELVRGAMVARQFEREYPEREIGIRHLVAYGQVATPLITEMVAYKTKTAIVVRWVAKRAVP